MIAFENKTGGLCLVLWLPNYLVCRWVSSLPVGVACTVSAQQILHGVSVPSDNYPETGTIRQPSLPTRNNSHYVAGCRRNAMPSREVWVAIVFPNVIVEPLSPFYHQFDTGKNRQAW